MVIIVDYGMGNVNSIANMAKKIGVVADLTADVDKIMAAEKLILPGVGAFDNAMQKLNELNLVDVLQEKVVDLKTPLLGICLGMQLLAIQSEEGTLPGLGWIKGKVVRFNFDETNIEDQNLKIPHMGWNTVKANDYTDLFADFDSQPRFYFVHSYHFQVEETDVTLAKTHYGYDFVCAVRKDNIFGTQFHPEKSHKFGKKLLENFLLRI